MGVVDELTICNRRAVYNPNFYTVCSILSINVECLNLKKRGVFVVFFFLNFLIFEVIIKQISVYLLACKFIFELIKKIYIVYILLAKIGK